MKENKFLVVIEMNCPHCGKSASLDISPVIEDQVKKILNKMTYEPQETELVRQCVKAGDTFFDIGANIGHYTLLAAELVGSGGKVYAFEPTPELFQKLETNIQGLNNVKSYSYAVSDKTGKTKLHYYTDTNANRIIDVAPFLNIPLKTTKVETIDLDSFYQGKIDFIKADVEGSEYLVFKGAERHLKENPDIKIMFEIPDFKVVELFSFLKELGFNLYLAKEKLEEFSIKGLNYYETIQLFKMRNNKTNIFCKR